MGHPDYAHDVRELPFSPFSGVDVVPPAPGWPQALGSSERYFVSMRELSPTNLARVIAIEGALPLQRLAWALRQLQARHPLLRAQIAAGPVPHFVHDALEHAPPLGLHSEQRRGDDHWHELLATRLNRPLGRAPLEVHALQAELGQRSELLVIADHAVCDGVSMNNLCAELLALCAQAAPRAPRALRPVLDQLLPSFTAWQRGRSLAGSLLRMGRIAASRVSEPPRRARSTASLHAELDVSTTVRLVAEARAQRTTLSGVLLAAVALAIGEQRPRLRRVAISIPINLRPHLPEQQLSPEDLGNYTSAAYLAAQRGGDLWTQARALKAELTRATERERLLGATSLVYRCGRSFVRENPRPLAHAMVSNSGVVPLQRDYGAFRTHGFHSATSAPMLSADYSFFCNTLHGRLTLNLVFAPEVVARDDAQRVLDRVRTHLLP